MATILAVDDDRAMRKMVRISLNHHGFKVNTAGDVAEARKSIQHKKPKLILLDWMLPDQSGYEFAKSLQSTPHLCEIPIIMLTARDLEEDKVAALEVGADDYIAKPFSINELIARIKSVLRRTNRNRVSETLRVKDLILDPVSHRVRVGTHQIELSPLEYQLLLFFMSHPERVFSRSELIHRIWGKIGTAKTFVEDRTVDVHIQRLRKVLAGFNHDYLIQTVRGAGYRFSDES